MMLKYVVQWYSVFGGIRIRIRSFMPVPYFSDIFAKHVNDN